MKKMNKKIAAMLAAVMAVSAMGSMSAFAYDIVTEGETASVDLKANITMLTDTTANPIQPVWAIEVNTAELVWNISTITHATKTITWNPATQSYSETTVNGGITSEVTNGATKNISVTNKSNFDISSTTAIAFESGQELFDATTFSPVSGNVFSVEEVFNLSGANGVTNTAPISITLEKPGALDEETPNDDTATKVATATISFNKVSEVYANN